MSSPHPTPTRPRLLARLAGATLAVLVACAGAQPAPVSAAAPPAARAAHSAQASDTDGDGIADDLDGCPTVAAATVTGCPEVWRKVALRWKAGQRRLLAVVSSPEPSCSSRARVKLFLDRRNRADKLLSSDASYRGRHRFKVAGGRRYYVQVSASYSSGVAECQKAVSRTVRVPR